MVALTNRNRTATPRKPNSTFQASKKPSKPNASILSFFQKTEKPEESLFVGQLPEAATAQPVATDRGGEDDLYSRNDDLPSEMELPNKRRRLSENGRAVVPAAECAGSTRGPASPPKAKPKLISPFIMDSDSEDDDQDAKRTNPTPTKADSSETNTTNTAETKDGESVAETAYTEVDAEHHSNNTDEPRAQAAEPPTLKHEATSHRIESFDEFGDLVDADFDNIEGDEMREWRFMKEQARLEAEESGDMAVFYETFGEDPFQEDSDVKSCPICSGSLSGVSEDEATRHVNSCLDGNPTPLPQAPEPPKADEKFDISLIQSKRDGFIKLNE